ncbi:MptD family putative ECF transporter S component [Schaalia sp. lx-100]|uniref:MptD family putative ECF transporter S component n=1 Tax=Schaalia sp. lx-100 TaxID=2899081 RepID=UPI001E319D5D|nr:MptD family putative ECF transporter S component [Schaalia sp. lx-100]MCD4557287.1 MptD family putative ECF transporter S component [Schaalia sp. lx-100]
MTTSTPTGHALTPRALINIGIFGAIYFFILFLSSLVSFVSPALHLVGILIGTLINATVVILFMVKTPRVFAMTLFGTLIGGTMALLGQFWGTVIVAALCGFIADLILYSGHYTSRWRACLAFGIFQFWLIAPLIPVIIGSDAFFQRITRRQGAEYADFMRSLFTPWFLIGFHIALCIVAVGAAWVGTRILDKHFSRAGIL